MRRTLRALFDARLPAVIAMLAMVAAGPAGGAPVFYSADLRGANESPSNPSPAVGKVQVTVDATAHTMRLNGFFSGLLATTTAAHVHAATMSPGSGLAPVATPTPWFPGFPGGVTAGTFDATLDMTLASSYNASFVNNHGGLFGAETFLYQSLADGTAYFNIHSTLYPGGEIRGFLVPGAVGVTAPIASLRPALRIAGANPFRSRLRLAYALPQGSRVELDILDLAGRRVQTLVSGDRAAGEHEARWDGDSEPGSCCGPGLYFARLRADGATTTLRVIRL